MRVLAIDTCSPVIGVALLCGDEVRERTARVTRGAEAHLLPWAQELAAEAGIRLSDLDGVGAARGPGAFTGLRVGLAAATGLAMAAGIPIWPGSSLVTRGARAGTHEPVLSMLDARKSRVYAAVVASDGSVHSGPGDVEPAVAFGWMSGSFLATGEGSAVYRERVEAAGGRVAQHADHPAVDVLARMAAAGIAAGEGVAPQSVRPVYLRAPDAKPPRSMRPS